VLVLVGSIPKGAPVGTNLDLSVRRGEFLVPVIILAAETIRRWCRDVTCTWWPWKTVRIIAVSLGGLAIIVCLIAATEVASTQISRGTGNSMVMITILCSIVALAFGSLGVLLTEGDR
jgi:hypothetical protein